MYAARDLLIGVTLKNPPSSRQINPSRNGQKPFQTHPVSSLSSIGSVIKPTSFLTQRVIERFSEDIDISIERAAFGFDETNAPEKLESKSKQKKTLEVLIASCSAFIHDMMLPKLNKSVAHSLGTREGWRIYSDETDATGQTLLFEYPSAVYNNHCMR